MVWYRLFLCCMPGTSAIVADLIWYRNRSPCIRAGVLLSSSLPCLVVGMYSRSYSQFFQYQFWLRSSIKLCPNRLNRLPQSESSGVNIWLGVNESFSGPLGNSRFFTLACGMVPPRAEDTPSSPVFWSDVHQRSSAAPFISRRRPPTAVNEESA